MDVTVSNREERARVVKERHSVRNDTTTNDTTASTRKETQLRANCRAVHGLFQVHSIGPELVWTAIRTDYLSIRRLK